MSWRGRVVVGFVGLLVAGSVVTVVHDARLSGSPRVGSALPATAMDLTQGPANNSPELVADPTDGRFVVEANRIDAPDFSCALQLSGDGGTTWSAASPVPHLPAGADKCYAPEAAFDRSGTLYYLFVGLAGGGNHPIGAFLTTSSDRGRTFATPRPILGPANFAVRMAIDTSGGGRGRLHVVWIHASGPLVLGGFPPTTNPILSAYSDDGGATFSAPVQISDPDRARVVAPSLALGPDHAVHVAYVDLGADARDYQGLAGPVWDGRWSIVVTTSTDGGQHFARGDVADDAVVPPERVMLIFTMPAPAVAAWADHLCLAWADARNGDSDVLARCSVTGSGGWGSAVRVNQDRIGNGHRQYLPRLSVSPGGRLDVVYLDRADKLGLTNQPDYTFSTDGGRSFARPVKLAAAPSYAGIGARYAGDSAVEQVEFGSRLALLSTDHAALAAWTDTHNSKTQGTGQDVFVARVAFPRRWGAGWAVAALLAALAVAGGAVALSARRRSPRPARTD